MNEHTDTPAVRSTFDIPVDPDVDSLDIVMLARDADVHLDVLDVTFFTSDVRYARVAFASDADYLAYADTYAFDADLDIDRAPNV